jgi:HSP20 family protein
MTEVDVKKNQKEEKAITRRGGNELASKGTWEPFSLWRTPSEFFSDPFSVMRRFREEMDRAFSRSFGEEFGGAEKWFTAIEVTEQNGAFQVQAEQPGLKPEDVKIEATDDSLIIQGERKYEHEENKQGVFRSERRYGKFYREIPLPEGAKVDQAKAQFNNGVLEVSLPVPERKSNRREIPISSGAGASESATRSATEQKK